ncbi:MAG: hypothetical protein AB7U83_01950 [Vicinamibacterales bacterium]
MSTRREAELNLRPAPYVGRLCRAATCLLLPFLMVAGCNRQATTPAESPAPEAVWHSLGQWSGRGDRQTDSFDVTTGALRLRWETRGEAAPGTGRLTVSLHSAISGRPLQTVVDTRGDGGGDATFGDDPRVSYLVIESAGVNWRLELFEAGAGR